MNVIYSQIILCAGMLLLAGCQATHQAVMPMDNNKQVKVYTANQTLPAL